jgi:hypothetical protein
VETLKSSQATASYVAGIPSGETCYDLQMNYEDTLGNTHCDCLLRGSQYGQEGHGFLRRLTLLISVWPYTVNDLTISTQGYIPLGCQDLWAFSISILLNPLVYLYADYLVCH